MNNYADDRRKTETTTRRCDQCQRETQHDRTTDGLALWTCRDERHQHPTLDEQYATTTDAERIHAALDLAIRYGQIDGAHHKTWVIDQIVRSLTGERYETTIAEACAGEDGPNTYNWDVGIAP